MTHTIAPEDFSTQAHAYWLTKKINYKDPVDLHLIKESIKDFVFLLTSKNIPVQYSNGVMSYTDGQTIVISGNVSDVN